MEYNKMTVFSSLIVEGIHFWSEAPEEVAYLSNAHRHMFHIEATASVGHTNRDVEIIQLKHRIRRFLAEKYYDETYKLCVFGKMSCEQIALELVNEFKLEQCLVSEDGENGSVIYKHNEMI